MLITVFDGSSKYELPFNEGDTILTVLQNGGIQNISAPCGGKGFCKKCEVMVRSKDKYVKCLSCNTAAEDGMIVELETEDRISFAVDSPVSIYPPTPGQDGYAIACDVGTSTIMCMLLDLKTGKVISEISGSNNANAYSSNVLSLLDAASEGHAYKIHELIIEQINSFTARLCTENGLTISDIKIFSATGNTIMMHFFSGVDPSQISKAPFIPVSLFGEIREGKEIGLKFNGPVYLCPSASAFIGSDVVCGILSCGIKNTEKSALMLDLGTNTEIVLGGKDGFIACAVDGGAAFKASLLEHGMKASAGAIAGAQYKDGEFSFDVLGNGKPKGICGSGFIDVLGIMFEQEVLDEMGHIADVDEVDESIAKYIGIEEGRNVFYLTKDKKIFISEADISKFQMAKAAIYAGIQILMKERKKSFADIERLYLCGGFGTFAHRRNSALLGIIPSECKGKTSKVGNTALAGAVSAAISSEAREKLNMIRDNIQVIDLPKHKDFNNLYVDGMIFE